MSKGRILYLEDDSEWVQHIQNLLDDDYDVYSASSPEEASKLLVDMAASGLKIDLAVIDISMNLGVPHDKQGFQFIEDLETSGVLQGHSIIILSGYAEVDYNLRIAFRDYDVIDVFDKGDFLEERSHFKQVVAETIERLRGIELLLPLATAWSEASEKLESPQRFESAVEQIIEVTFGHSVTNYERILSKSDEFVVFSLDTSAVFEGISSLGCLPVIFWRAKSLVESDFDRLKQFLSKTVFTLDRVALLILFVDSALLQALQHSVDRKLNRIYAYDIIIVGKEALESILTAESL